MLVNPSNMISGNSKQITIAIILKPSNTYDYCQERPKRFLESPKLYPELTIREY